MKNIILVFLVALFWSCSTQPQTEQIQEQKNKVLWTSETGFVHPESVIFSEKYNCYFVSNIGNDESKKTPDGFISKVKLDGNIETLKFTDSIRSPKGLCIVNDKIYVSALSDLLEIDLSNGEILHRYTNNEVVFLNDVCSDNKGQIYISGMRENTIYQLKQGELLPYFKSDSLEHPNGVFFQNEKMYIGGWGNMDENDVVTDSISYLFSLERDQNLNHVTKRIGKMDGIQKNGSGLLCSSWKSGEIFSIDENGKAKLLLKTEQSAGDIYYNDQTKILIVPLNFQHKLIAYKL